MTNQPLVRISLLTVLALGAGASAAELHVPGQYATIPDALIAANAGDTVIVAPGTYSNGGFPVWSSTFTGGANVKVRSSGGPDVTILDGLDAGRVVELFLGESNDTVLEGFTLRNGTFPTNWGGAALFLGSAPTVVNCVFETSSAAYGGGVANYESGTAVFMGCVFRNNTATSFGGGVANFDASPVFRDCVFENNEAVDAAIFTEGGGAAHRLATARYENCRFEGNSAEDGGGMHVRNESDVELIDCVFIDNLATTATGGGVRSTLDSSVHAAGSRFLGNQSSQWGGGIMSSFSTDLKLVNCEFSGNRSGLDFTRSGGGLYAQSHTGVVEVFNCVFAGNMASSGTGAGWHATTGATVSQANNIFWANLGGFGFEGIDPTRDENDQVSLRSATVVSSSNCIIDQYASTPGAGHLALDPMFVDAPGVDGVVGTEDDDLRVGNGSPAIDAGDNGALPMDALDLDGDLDVMEEVPFDGTGNARRTDDPGVADTGVGAAPIVDIGAYERVVAVLCPQDLDGDGDVDFADLNIVLGEFNMVGQGLAGDVDGDGDVDFADLNAVLGVFNSVCG